MKDSKKEMARKLFMLINVLNGNPEDTIKIGDLKKEHLENLQMIHRYLNRHKAWKPNKVKEPKLW